MDRPVTLFIHKMFTNLHLFISTSTPDPIISTWSQISDSRCTMLYIYFVKENNVHSFMGLSHVQTTIEHMISNNPDLLLISRWVYLDSFPHIIHNQILSSLSSTLPTTCTLDMSLFKASEFGDTVDSHRFSSFLLETINTP